MDEGELDSLMERHEKEPDRVIPTSATSVSITSFNGKTYVWGCPCERLEDAEDFLWGIRAELCVYFKDRATRELEEAQASLASVSIVTAHS
jgi:hypothetical protein